MLPRMRGLVVAASLYILLLVGADTAAAQSILQQYREARFEARAEEILRRHGLRSVPRPPDHVPSAADTLAAWWNRRNVVPEAPPPPPPFEHARWRPLKRLERGWFERNFADVQWAYSGNARHTRLDTTATPEIRARLEDRFGAPTLSLVEVSRDTTLDTDASIQFEYWVVLNDSIPIRIMDVGGPLDRGVILVSSSRMRDQLPSLRSALQRELFDEATEAPYIDYFFDELTGDWYESGYDGRGYFTRSIQRPAVLRRRSHVSGN